MSDESDKPEKCFTLDGKKKVMPSKKYQSKILRSSLIELLSIPQNQRVDVRDLNGNFSLRVKVGAIAVGGLYDGRIRVYGGSGSDEFSACWCFEIPFDVNDGLPEDVLEIDVYFYSHEFQIVIPVYC